METILKLEPGRLYHIYNRGNNREDIFLEERNYDYFIALYEKYFVQLADTYAYCMLKNHSHLLVRIRDHSNSDQQNNPSRQLSNMFNSYAKSINKAYGRTSALFERPFERIEVTSEVYLIQLILYIHLNPQGHGLVKNFELYPYSSYRTILSNSYTFLNRKEVIGLFGTREGYIRAHRGYRKSRGLMRFIGDDEFF